MRNIGQCLQCNCMVAKETILFGDAAFYGLAWPAVKIPLPELDSSKNFASGGIYHILAFFGLVHAPAPTLVSLLQAASTATYSMYTIAQFGYTLLPVQTWCPLYAWVNYFNPASTYWSWADCILHSPFVKWPLVWYCLFINIGTGTGVLKRSPLAAF